MSKTSKTIQYYNNNADLFFENTFQIDMNALYSAFEQHLPLSGKILDVGCGSGRDALYFSKLGYEVEAFDNSEKLVEMARQKTGLNIEHKSFYDITAVNEYAGIWACASLLHCEKEKLADVVLSIITALKQNGICYLSFKYGSETREVSGRYFTDMNEKSMKQLLQPFNNIEILKQWITEDLRPDREEKWLNLIFKKRDLI